MLPTDPIRVLTLQPFYGGSHRQFIDSWIAYSSLSWQVLELPARHWKWRMRQSAVHFAAEVDRLYLAGHRWDMIVCTDMLNLAEFKGLLRTPVRELPCLVYFHENQFEYPDRQNRERDFHFAFTNFTTAVAADIVWFNSQFNRETMLGHLRRLSSSWPDFAPRQQIQQIADKAAIERPGVQFVSGTCRPMNVPLHLVWAARWEHDKNPAQFLEILKQLRVREFEFQLSVLGQGYTNVPREFATIADMFATEIRHWGFQSSRDDYLRILAEADVFLSTASHEFFGLSAVEAICCGCIPLLPNRLVYPEWLHTDVKPDRRQFLYESVDQAVEFIVALPQSDVLSVATELTNECRQQYAWSGRADAMDALIVDFLQTSPVAGWRGDLKQLARESV